MRADHAVSFASGAALGFACDLAFGDPRRGHPVAAFGRAAAAVERRLWHDHRGYGALHTLLCAGGAAAGAALLTRTVRLPAAGPARTATGPGRTATPGPSSSPAARSLSRAADIALTAAATWSVLGGTSLRREALAIGDALAAGDLAAARARLPHLCGRDPQALDGQQIARAVVESVAENTSDAVVGALVWGAIGGVPGLVGFRAVNTLDAMVGHKSPRHRRFGWASARLDDVAGWPGARLTAALATVAGPDPRGARRVWRADGGTHPSPNAGPVEASFAGALGVRLGGTLAYGGRVEHRPVLNAHGRPVEVPDIARAARLSRRVGALALATSVAGRLAVCALRSALSDGGRRTVRPKAAGPGAAG
ncbi:cobalamin biosynthesis protein [Streptomyces sp. XD-27]|uniref:cobalamin biosynthesis protein n=1 Tax=Streptomyces sp. XD-27 TaxID=3062779 RepID=UPI0026F4104D|nr:cobalamin biosynthesis protein [Streptomyces sp. XD-27]WKX69679.1 cobalamin biosynthesis protein [Streptomyces sp. XD-27]